MNYPHRLFSWKIPLLLASLVGLTLFILACGDDATPEPTAAPPPAAATVDISAITSDIKQTIQEEVGKIQPPLSEAEIRNLIESAVSTGVPEGVSAEEIQSMVDSAVAAAAAEGVTQTDVTVAIGAAVAARGGCGAGASVCHGHRKDSEGFHTDACTCGYGHGGANGNG